jgi:hypothetical protein
MESSSPWPFPVSGSGLKEQLAAEVTKIIAHAKTKGTMNEEDDKVAEPLIQLLKDNGYIPKDAGAFLEWQGSWEHNLAAVCFGKLHEQRVGEDYREFEERWLNIYPDGQVVEC